MGKMAKRAWPFPPGTPLGSLVDRGIDAKGKERPAAEHSLFSPSGKMSKRARKAAMKREHDRLFPPGFWDEPPISPQDKAKQRACVLRRSAKNLRDLASRGMRRRKYTLEADKLELEADKLELEAGEKPRVGRA